MDTPWKYLRIAVGVLVAAVSIPIALFLGVFALGIALLVMIVGIIASRFMPKPRWGDQFQWEAYQAETVRTDQSKPRKRPIIIDHE